MECLIEENNVFEEYYDGEDHFLANNLFIEDNKRGSYTINENAPAFKVFNYSKLKEGEKPLEKVIGHENQKKELLSVIDWFNHSKEFRSKGISIPKGVILFGSPGNGKSLLMKEIIRCCECPVFVFQGEQSNVVKGIVETFREAKEAGHAIIVFDELDLLINNERRVVRALQENLDGVESNDDILVLAATNLLSDIPSPLLRHGRLEKLIKITYPTGEEALELLKKYFREFNLKFKEELDEEQLALSLSGICFAGVKSIVNDLVLRNGFDDLTSEMVDNSIYNVTYRVKEAPEEDNIEVAIHEAGHALVAKAFPKYFTINRLNISGASGEFHAKELEKDFWPYDKIIADIKISMAGVIAQKVIFGRASRGCEDDLQNARKSAYNMINMCGFSSCWETLPVLKNNARADTFIKRRKMERKIEALLKKCEKETYKYVKKHKHQIIGLGNLLFEKKHLKSKEILSCIG